MFFGLRVLLQFFRILQPRAGQKFTFRRIKKGEKQDINRDIIREEALDVEISSLLKPFALRDDWTDEMLSPIKEEKKQSAQSAALVVAEKRVEIEKVNLRLQKLLDAFLDGVIERNDYTTEKAKLMSQKKSLEEQCAALSTGRASWLEPCPRLQKSPWFLRKSVVTTRRKIVEWWNGARCRVRTCWQHQ